MKSKRYSPRKLNGVAMRDRAKEKVWHQLVTARLEVSNQIRAHVYAPVNELLRVTLTHSIEPILLNRVCDRRPVSMNLPPRKQKS